MSAIGQARRASARCRIHWTRRQNEKLRQPFLGRGALSIEDCEAAYLEAGFTAVAGLAAAGVVLVLPTGFLMECLCTFFTGFFVTAGAVEVAAGAAGFAGVFCAGGFWAANIVVVATAKAIVSKVFFMAFFSLASLVVRSPYNSMVGQMGKLLDSLHRLGRGTN
jgi:hypothetical protein